MSNNFHFQLAKRLQKIFAMCTPVSSRSCRFTQLAVLLAACLAIGLSQTQAATVTYWRFGDDPSDPFNGSILDGDWVQPTTGRTQIDPSPGSPQYVPGYDSSGNGNTLYGWDAGGAGHNYRFHVASSTVGGNSNEWSIQNGGGFPAAFTWSQQSSPGGTNLETFTPSQWTIEATVKPTTVDGNFRTFVGREGNTVDTADANAAPLYFQMTNTNQFRINYTDAANTGHIATSNGLNIIENQWYHVAATSDGTTLSLYVDQFDGTGYQLAATADLSGSANSAMIDPGLPDPNGGGTDTWGWTVGRGRYGTSRNPVDDHTDRFFGNIDEVRISDTALAPGSFLFAGQNLNPGPRLEVNRDTGEFTLVNMQASIDLVAYNITSASGVLDPNSWYSIHEFQDSDCTVNCTPFDTDDPWAIDVDNDPATSFIFSEGEGLNDGGQLGVGGTTSLQLGLAGAWTRSSYEDLQMTIEQLNPDFSTSVYTVPVVFSGGVGGQPYARSDLDLDGDVDPNDWVKFRSNHLTDLSGLSIPAASVFGDLDGDLDNDFNDFRMFQADYDNINGLGAFAAMIAAVPEPSTWVLMTVGCVPFVWRRRKFPLRRRMLMSRVPILTLSLSIVSWLVASASLQAELTHRYSFDTDTSDSVGSADGTLNGPATVSGGLLNLNNPGFSPADPNNGWLNLPPSILPSSGSVTIEQWFNFTGSGFFTEAWTFSDRDGGANPPGADVGQYFMHTISNPQGGPVPAGGGSSIAQTLTGYGGGAETRAYSTTPGIGAGGGGYLDNGVDFFAATVIDADLGTLSYYVYRLSDGVGGLQDSITAIPLSSYSFTEAFLGRSPFDADNGTSGTVDEFRIFDSARNASTILADFQAGPNTVPGVIELLVAEVNETTGEVVLKNVSANPITFDYYLIKSAGGALDPVGWDSLDDQSYDAGLAADFDGSGGPVNGADLAKWESDYAVNAGSDADHDGDSDGDDFLIWQRQSGQIPGPGDSWDEGGGSNSTQLAELFLNNASTLGPGESVSLGAAYDPGVSGVGNGDLTFQFGLQGSSALDGGGVVYVSSLSAATAVPEPATLSLLVLFAAGAMTVNRRSR